VLLTSPMKLDLIKIHFRGKIANASDQWSIPAWLGRSGTASSGGKEVPSALVCQRLV